jgi:MFS family permease
MLASKVLPVRHSRTLSALRHANFRLYFMGQFVSICGTWMLRVAQGWLVFELTKSEFWLGVVAFASGLPMLFIAPFAGVLADRASRRLIWLCAQAIEMLAVLVLAVLTFTEVVQIWHLVGVACVLGVTAAFGEPSRVAFIKDMVGPDDLNSGVALTAIMGNSGVIIGPTLAGILLVQVGPAWCFLSNGLSFIGVLIALLLIKIKRETLLTTPPRPLQQLKDGLHSCKNHATIAPMLLMAAVINILGTNMVITLLPAFASTVLHSPKEGYAALNTALGIGGLTGSLLNVWLGSRFGRGHVLAAVTCGLPLAELVLSQMGSLFPAITVMGVLGFGFTMFFVTTNVLIQTEVSEEFRGRVISLWALNRFGLAPVAALLIGVIANAIGTPAMMVVCSVLGGMLCSYIIMHRAALRRLP